MQINTAKIDFVVGEKKFHKLKKVYFEKKARHLKRHNVFTFHDYLPQICS